jgi:hypothetical protein
MQSAETVLGVLRDRGRRGLPCNELYRQLFNPQLFLLAYGRIYANKGAMTPGVTQETVDGMSDIEVHHIRRLADLGRPGQPRWAEEMQRRRRKTLVLCGNCHAAAHNLVTAQ